MKRNQNQSKIIAIVFGVLPILLITAGIIASFGFKKAADDIWKQLGLEKKIADKSIRQSFIEDFLDYKEARNIKHIPFANRKAVAQSLLNYTKNFMNTKFKVAYENERLASKPQPPELKPLRTIEEIQKEEIDRLQTNISETEKNLKAMNSGMRDLFEASLEKNKKLLAEYQDTNCRALQSIAKAEKNGRDWNLFAFKQNMKKWQERYPGDFNSLIKMRLKKLLELTDNVDFKAETKIVDGRKIFVNAAYEEKNPEWKMAFRAGKEVTEITRAFAKQWLKELN